MENSNSLNENGISSVTPLLEDSQQTISPLPLPSSSSATDKITPLPSFVSNADNDKISSTNSLLSAPSSSQLPALPSIPSLPLSFKTSTNDLNFNQSQTLYLQNINIAPSLPAPPVVNSVPIPNTISALNSTTDIILFSSRQDVVSNEDTPFKSMTSLHPIPLNPCLDTTPIERSRPIDFANEKFIEVKCSWCSKKHRARFNKQGKPIKLCLSCSAKKKNYRTKKHQK